MVDRRASVASGPLRSAAPGYDVYGGAAAPYAGGYEDDYGDDYADDYADDYGDQDLTVAAPMSGRPRRGPLSRAQLRSDFGAHFEDNYQRLVAQLFAITLNSGEAHEVVQDAYSRAWRQWATVGRLRDPSEWIRRVAVRSTIRSWRRTLARVGFGRPKPIGDDAVEPRTAALLSALARLPIAERRAIVLHHMVGWSIAEIAVVERSSPGSVSVRLARAAHLVGRALPDLVDRYEDEYDPDQGEEQR
ncbi:RNA polymerase sigma factor [Pseudonocardia humida]|uniref:RNA polymerase sigma factor n=1 Tax=Pseudonocardia humida TaxID=2800819 RepID=A0ABT1A4B2_9PSEU|nr:RNA polymerase sigma factor [Pseudonocardia humida]MCO1657786.1 RNA polymerase sigma factor [Pseudonocardia humida]